jgi:RHS repeat-associated protein
VKKTEGGQTTLYVNRYYEKDITAGEAITSYYLGGKLIAQRKYDSQSQTYALSYILQGHLGSTTATADSDGDIEASLKYLPFGGVRSSTGTMPTDRKFTGQRLDQTGLYYYNARYYDATIGRFISADIFVQNAFNSQTLNRYSYVLNNPIRYIDPTGNLSWEDIKNGIDDVVTSVTDGLQVAEAKVVEMTQAIVTKGSEVYQGIIDAAGIESIETTKAGTSESEARIITVKEGGMADKVILEGIGDENTWGISLYPTGIFLKAGYSTTQRNHETFHYQQQKTWKTGWVGWYYDYLSELEQLKGILGSENDAYKYCSFEQEARIFAGQQANVQIPPNLLQVLNGDPRLAQMIYDYFYSLDFYYYLLILNYANNGGGQ